MYNSINYYPRHRMVSCRRRYPQGCPLNRRLVGNRSSLDALLTYSLTPWCRVLLEKLTGLKLVKKFPTFYGTRRFVTALTSVRHLSLSCASSIQSTYPHPTWRLTQEKIKMFLALPWIEPRFLGHPSHNNYATLAPLLNKYRNFNHRAQLVGTKCAKAFIVRFEVRTVIATG